MEDVEYEIDKEGSVCLSQYDKYELTNNVICVPPDIAVMIAKEILHKRNKWTESND